MHSGADRVVRAWLDETSLLLEPTQTSRYVGILETATAVPQKGSMRCITLLPVITDDEDFTIPIFLNLGTKQTRLWEKKLVAERYNCNYPAALVPGEITMSHCGKFCIAFSGSNNGSTHMN